MEQRVIKFRAWNDADKEMFVPGPAYRLERNGELTTIEKIYLMQFTGFTNNGQDWYDGDILENDSDWYQIGWDNETGQWWANGMASTHESIALHELLSSETWVQGNIHEPPEWVRKAEAEL
jgi:hypothetical protein